MKATQTTTILATLVTLALLSGCAATADLTVDGNGSSGHGDEILQTMERDSARG